MNIKKFISLLLIVVVLFSVCSLSINTKAETSKNILLGILPKASTTDNWMLDNRPLSNITDGTSTTLTDDNNAWGSPGRLDNVKGESYSWCRFDLPVSTNVNKVVVQQRGGMCQSSDIAIDVLLSSGGWKRVGLKYNVEDTYHAITFAFETVNVNAIQIVFNNKRNKNDGTDIAEIEAYFDEKLQNYDEFQNADNQSFVIADSFDFMNLLRGIKATSSNTDEWYATDRPVSNMTNGSGTFFSVGWEAEYGEVCSVTSIRNTGHAWVQFELPQEKTINKIIIQQINESSGIIQTKDFAVEVLLQNHNWKRVASSYDTNLIYSALCLTFEPQTALALRIIGMTDVLNLKEVEAYYDNTITEYNELSSYDSSINGIQSPKIGDLNTDYRFDAVDLVVLRQMLIGKESEFLFVDQNDDSKLSVIDLVRMKKDLSTDGDISDNLSYGSFAKPTDIKEIDDLVNDDVNTSGKTYYVDAINGNDENTGLSKDKALLTLNSVNNLSLEPGDRVLFKRGCVWNGTLVIKNSGTAKNPIVIGMYGEGSKPMINGCSQVEATVLLLDVSYVTVRNLDLTNYSAEVSDFRSCISVVSRKNFVKGIKIQNNYVHSSANLFDLPEGSIGFHSFGAINVKAEKGIEWNGEDVNFQDVVIENNRVERVNGNGISAYGGLKNLQINNNIVNNARGDGIILAQCFDSVAQFNTVYSSGWGGIGQPHVNIWCYNATNTIIQYNESYDCQSTVGDGQGFDIDDACINCVVQYNYSHDNIGGFFLACAYYKEHYGTVVRYNISQNDNNQLLFLTCPSSDNLDYDNEKLMYDIYNNTFYTTRPITDVIYNDYYESKYTNYGKIRNNIFYVIGSSTAKWGKSNQAFEFSNNCYYGVNSTNITDTNKITVNPMLLAVGTARIGRNTCGGYQLLKNSPCISKGVIIDNNAKYDFWDNVIDVNTSNIGAYAGKGVARAKDMNLAAGRIATTSFTSESNTYSLNNLTDERVSTAVTSKKRIYNKNEWIEISFDESIPLSCVWLTASENSNLFPLKYSIEVFVDDTWLTVADSTGREQPENFETYVFNFETIKTQKFRISVIGMPSTKNLYYMEIAEIGAFSYPMAIGVK